LVVDGQVPTTELRLSDDAQRARDELCQAMLGDPSVDSAAWLQSVAEAIPLGIGVDFVNLRVLSTSGVLHVVGSSGWSAGDVRRCALAPLRLEAAWRLLSRGADTELARSFGIRWSYVSRLESRGQLLGTIAIGCRTRRRPQSDDLRFLEEVAAALAERLERLDRSEAAVGACALALARVFAPAEGRSCEPPRDDLVRRLRPRELAILELYADGLSTQQIADLYVLSRHTVRTHVRNALRTLGVHRREDAATIVLLHHLDQPL
jgi:DNA-binding NarL/FixJ family response regulator